MWRIIQVRKYKCANSYSVSAGLRTNSLLYARRSAHFPGWSKFIAKGQVRGRARRSGCARSGTVPAWQARGRTGHRPRRSPACRKPRRARTEGPGRR